MKVLNKFGLPAKRHPTSFSAVTPINIGIRPQHFLTYSYNLFSTFVKFQGHTYCQFQIIELEPRAPLKKIGFSGEILIKLKL